MRAGGLSCEACATGYFGTILDGKLDCKETSQPGKDCSADAECASGACRHIQSYTRMVCCSAEAAAGGCTVCDGAGACVECSARGQLATDDCAKCDTEKYFCTRHCRPQTTGGGGGQAAAALRPAVCEERFDHGHLCGTSDHKCKSAQCKDRCCAAAAVEGQGTCERCDALGACTLCSLGHTAHNGRCREECSGAAGAAGAAVSHGAKEFRVQYTAAATPPGRRCDELALRQARLCEDGAFGAWKPAPDPLLQLHGTCVHGCPFGLAHGEARNRTRYLAPAAPHGSACSAQLQFQACNQGVVGAWIPATEDDAYTAVWCEPDCQPGCSFRDSTDDVCHAACDNAECCFDGGACSVERERLLAKLNLQVATTDMNGAAATLGALGHSARASQSPDASLTLRTAEAVVQRVLFQAGLGQSVTSVLPEAYANQARGLLQEGRAIDHTLAGETAFRQAGKDMDELRKVAAILQLGLGNIRTELADLTSSQNAGFAGVEQLVLDLDEQNQKRYQSLLRQGDTLLGGVEDLGRNLDSGLLWLDERDAERGQNLRQTFQQGFEIIRENMAQYASEAEKRDVALANGIDQVSRKQDEIVVKADEILDQVNRCVPCWLGVAVRACAQVGVRSTAAVPEQWRVSVRQSRSGCTHTDSSQVADGSRVTIRALGCHAAR